MFLIRINKFVGAPEHQLAVLHSHELLQKSAALIKELELRYNYLATFNGDEITKEEFIMGKYLERCKELRHGGERSYRCAAAVFIPFAEDCGIDHDTAYHMVRDLDYSYCDRYIGTCGAVVAGLLALGLFNCSYGIKDTYMKRLKAHHGASLDCEVLCERWKTQNNIGKHPFSREMSPTMTPYALIA